MNQKPFEKWTFDELVDYSAGEILKALIAGRFRTQVYLCLDMAIRWQRENLKETKKGKK